MKLILASQSPYRKALLEQLSLRFEAHRPEVDEEELKQTGPTEIFELTRFLAFHKAQSLRARFPEAVILGSDQIAEVDGQRLDKPGTRERAVEQLRKLRGRTHRLVTSLVVAAPSQVQTFTDITSLHMRALSDAEIEAYLDVDTPFDCAGAYKIERGGMALLESLKSEDPSAIQGLPILSLSQALRNLGGTWDELWRPSKRSES